MILDLQAIKNKYKNFPKNILHLGAHLAEEITEYEQNGFEEVIWVEGNEKLIPDLTERLAHSKIKNYVYNILISENDKEELIFNITDFDQSSSVLEPSLTKKFHKTKVNEQIRKIGRRLDVYFEENNIHLNKYKFLMIDLQGYELQALKSLGDNLKFVDFIITEVNLKELYTNGTRITDLDAYLLKNGFKRHVSALNRYFWGDALYVRESNQDLYTFYNKMTSLINIKFNLINCYKKYFWYKFLVILYTLKYKFVK